MPGAVLMICSAGRSMSPVVWLAPDTRPSASPWRTISTPWYMASAASRPASSRVRPFALRSA